MILFCILVYFPASTLYRLYQNIQPPLKAFFTGTVQHKIVSNLRLKWKDKTEAIITGWTFILGDPGDGDIKTFQNGEFKTW